mmetsp:Transcript_20860/g.28987  ORF Transcript_20860/g.28987 Transcript_20860/m.28987 type:complete len:266 (-) Transcript_20860:10-807(-)
MIKESMMDKKNNVDDGSAEERRILESLGISTEILKEEEVNESSLSLKNNNHDNQEPQQQIHPALAMGLGCAFLFNMGILLSLPPVIRGKGAPYLPTFQKGLNSMFSQLKNDAQITKAQTLGKPLTFVDLGSGDGRVVFRAAREGIFHKSIGYEINPLLHIWAQSRRIIQAPLYWSSTNFALRDIWKVNLTNVDVVAVYGLDPIMRDLGKKLKNELKPGSLVVSNVFTIPGWKPSKANVDGVTIYKVPDCWETSLSTNTTNMHPKI